MRFLSSLPMTASFLGTLTFQSQRYYVGLWKVQLPILSFTHYSHAKKWVKPRNDENLMARRLGAGWRSQPAPNLKIPVNIVIASRPKGGEAIFSSS